MLLFVNNHYLLIRDREPGKGIKMKQKAHLSIWIGGIFLFYVVNAKADVRGKR